jgi:hypothetical protein
VRFSVAIVEEFRDVSPESGNLKVAIMDRPALNPTLALVSVCGDISPSLQVMNLEVVQETKTTMSTRHKLGKDLINHFHRNLSHNYQLIRIILY